LSKITVKKADEVEVKPFALEDFLQVKERQDRIKQVTKKELKNIAESLGMTYTEEEISFAKKLIMAYNQRETV